MACGRKKTKKKATRRKVTPKTRAERQARVCLPVAVMVIDLAYAGRRSPPKYEERIEELALRLMDCPLKDVKALEAALRPVAVEQPEAG